MLAATDGRFVARPAPKLIAGALSLAVHVLFVVMLVFGVSWQTQPTGPVAVDLWEALPAASPPPRPRPVPPPEPVKPEAVKPAPAPEPAPVPKPTPVPKPVAEPAPKAPDIALERKRAEQKAMAEAAAREREQAERQRAEAQRREQLRRQEEAELMRRMAEEEAAEAARLTQLAEARAAASRRQAEAASLIAQYRDLISAKVRGNTRLPDNLVGNPEVRIRVRLLPTGEVQSVQLTRSSGNPAYDDAVLRAIEKSSPLPLPADRDARAAFVPELSFVHRPKD
ncbi:MAG: energy transducer TonB [Thiobacillus sp.]